MSVHVRRAGLDDLDALVPLQQEVHRLHVAQRPDQFQSMSDDEAAGALRAKLEAPNVKVWLAQRGGRVDGYAVAVELRRDVSPFSPARRWCEIDAVGVAAEQRRSGIGRALLQAVVDDARASGIVEIELSSWAFNRDAHAAFERFGFTPKHLRFELKRAPPTDD